MKFLKVLTLFLGFNSVAGFSFADSFKTPEKCSIDDCLSQYNYCMDDQKFPEWLKKATCGASYKICEATCR